jgi:hypothetical protein
MTDQLYQELPSAQGRRLIFWAVLRGVLGATVLVVLYYVLPLDEPWNGGTAVRVLIGLMVFAGITVWQVRTIAGSRYAGMKALRRGLPPLGSAEGWDCLVVDFLPDRLLVVLLPVGAWQRDGPARPGPGRPSWGGPHPGPDGHAGREFHG